MMAVVLHAAYFGKLMDLMRCTDETLSPPASVTDTQQLRTWLDGERGLDGALLAPTVRLAVNDAIVAGTVPLVDGDRVAFMPPVGGG